MQPCFRKGTEISAMLNSLADPLHGEMARLRPLYECHRSFQPWPNLCSGYRVVILSVDPLLQEGDVGLWHKELATQRIPQTQGQMGVPQYSGQRHEALPLFCYWILFWTIFLPEGYFHCMNVYGASNWSCTTGPWGPSAGCSKGRGQSPCVPSRYICQGVTASKYQAGLASKLDTRLGS